MVWCGVRGVEWREVEGSVYRHDPPGSLHDGHCWWCWAGLACTGLDWTELLDTSVCLQSLPVSPLTIQHLADTTATAMTGS